MSHNFNTKIFFAKVGEAQPESYVEVYNPAPDLTGSKDCKAYVNFFNGAKDIRELEGMRDCLDKVIEEMKTRLGQL